MSVSGSRTRSDDIEEDEALLKFNTLTGWQSLLLLQFQAQMSVAVICGIYLTYVLIMVDLSFALGSELHHIPVKLAGTSTSVIYPFDLFYFIDLVSMLIFKNVKWSNITLSFKARSGLILFTEFLSIIPIDVVYFAMVHLEANMKTLYCLRLRYALRLFRLYDFHKISKEYLGANSYMLLVIVYLGFLMIISVTIGCAAYVYNCVTSDVMCAYQDYKVLAASFYSSTTILTVSGVTDPISEEWSNVIQNNIVFSFVAFILNAYFISYFTCDIIHLLKSKFAYINICTKLKNFVKLWKTTSQDWKSYHKKIETLFDQYEYVYWNRNKGVKPSDYLGKVLPAIMYKEIVFDMSWVPLKHTHLFRNEDVHFLRLLSTITTHKFYFPGEVIYKRNSYKNCMVYIVSGIAEILSEEDGETPIISLSSGTCLGEATLILDYLSTCSVVSKNVCNVVKIHRRDFIKISSLYPAKYNRTRNEVMKRIANAKMYQGLSKYQFDGQKFQEQIGVLTMKWLKLILRSLLFNVRKLGDLYSRHYLQKLEQNVFCTEYLDLLVIAEDVDLTSDSVFIKNTFPFIFKERSVLLNMWNIAVIMLSVCLATTYPYFVVFVPSQSLEYKIFHAIITLMWMVDLYLRMSTAIKSKYVSYVKLTDIVVHNFTSKTFILDVLAAVPLELLIYLIEGQLTENISIFFQCNRLLKLYKIDQFFQSARVSTHKHVLLKYTKFTIYLFFLYYYVAAILYKLACSNNTCTADYEQFTKDYGAFSAYNKLFVSFVSVIDFTNNLEITKFPFFTSSTSYVVLIILEILLLLFNVFFLAYISAAETLNKHDIHTAEEFTRNIAITMKCFNLNAQLQERVWNYVKLQYDYSGIHFLDSHVLFEHLPEDLYVISKNIHLGSYIRNVPLFHNLGEEIISQVCTIVTVHLFPPNEVFKRIGEVCSEIHIITNGTCSMVTSNGETATLEVGDCFSIVESFLKIQSMINVTTLTQCKIISIDYEKIMAIMLRYPVHYEQIQSTVRHCQNWTDLRSFLKVTAKEVKIRPATRRNSHVKSFGYKLKKRTKSFNEYHDGFPKWGSLLKYILLRHTFRSNGKIVYYWEISRGVFAFATNMIFPMSYVAQEYYNGWYFARLFLHLTGYVDIYFRHHITYFNKKGLEVMHPYETAKYYWTHALLIDFIASFRTDYFQKSVYWDSVCLLQLYRLHEILKHYSQKISSKGLSTIILYIPYVLLFTNQTGCFIFRNICEVKQTTVACKNDTWVGRTYNNTNPFETYIFTLFFTTAALTSTFYSNIDITDKMDMLIITLCVIFGYLFYNYLVAKSIAANLAINYDLISYQEEMGNLVKFMSYKRIDKKLKTEIINHFEYMWNKTNGKSIHKAFASFKTSFKVDALYNIFGMKFEESTIFPSPNQSFFKSLLLDVKHEIYLNTGVVYRVNDINGIVYILFKGQIEVLGADENRLLTLHVGSVFGNLDNCPMGRRTLTMIASGHVEVLAVSSSVFHGHLHKFPILNKHFQRLTIFNVDFLEESHWQPEHEKVVVQARSSIAHTNLYKEEKKRQRCKPRIYNRNKYIIIWETIILGIVSFGSYLLGLYHLATTESSMYLYSCLYILDFFYVVKIYLVFHTSYEDEFGKNVFSRRQISKRYITAKLGFYFDLFTIIPFELACLFFIDSKHLHDIWGVCRMNRIVRIVHLVLYLKSMTQKLNINVFTMRTLYLMLWVIMLQFTLGCLIHVLDVIYKTKLIHQSLADSVQLIINSSAKLSTKVEFEILNTIIATCYIFCGYFSKMIAIFFIAESCAILYVTNRTRYLYEQFLIFMKMYMESENVSQPLSERLNTYMNLLWTYHQGSQFPKLLQEAPHYLNEALLNSMFGFHFRKHPIMKNCHIDLIRQMTSQLKTMVLFPGDIVVYTGDIDHCMYFIQEGEVQALSEDTMYSEIVAFTLKSGDMFGFDQGIYYRCGHNYTYKVTMYSMLVYLRRDDWIYLLAFFPASKLLMYDKAKET